MYVSIFTEEEEGENVYFISRSSLIQTPARPAGEEKEEEEKEEGGKGGEGGRGCGGKEEEEMERAQRLALGAAWHRHQRHTL